MKHRWQPPQAGNLPEYPKTAYQKHNGHWCYHSTVWDRKQEANLRENEPELWVTK